jgi:large subunit ribosomal protein L24
MFYVTESEKDTKASDVTEITFEPALKTFEIDIMERMGIQEDRVPAKTYWY